MTAIMPTNATQLPRHNGLAEVQRLQSLVEAKGACSLPGCTLIFDRIVPVLQRAVIRGFVSLPHAQHTFRSLRFGYTGGAQQALLERSGQRPFRNYPSAIAARAAVTRSLNARIAAGKSLLIGKASNSLYSSISSRYASWFMFSLGAVPKAMEPNEMRPVSDHSKSGLNACCDLTHLKHTYDTYNDIAMHLLKGYFMHVSDVKDAFPTLPLAPWLWPFYMCRFFINDDDSVLWVIMHLFADFGGAGWPGEFHLFFSKVIVGMARSELVLTLEMPIYVDDMGLLGEFNSQVRREMRRFQLWAMALGLLFKWLKDRVAARTQLMIGFWWDSKRRIRTLEERRFGQYMEMLLDFASRRSLTLVERQRGIGRMTRAIMTLPPGAKCLMGEMLRLARGLHLPWQARRTTKVERGDYRNLHRYLSANLGRGYFSYDGFDWAPETRGDACKSQRKAGGGFASKCGRFYFCKYGSSARRKPIVILEGDQLIAQATMLGHNWEHKLVPVGIDNQTFQFAQVKGWSPSPAVHDLLRILFELQLRGAYVLRTYWLDTHMNDVADHFSRERIQEAISAAYQSGFWDPEVFMRQVSNSGEFRVVAAFSTPASFGTRSSAVRFGTIVRERCSEVQRRQLDFMLAYPSAAFRLGTLCRLRLSIYDRNKLCRIITGNGSRTKPNFHISYPRCSIYDHMEVVDATRTAEIMDSRLAASSLDTVDTAKKKWFAFCSTVLFCNPIILTDDPERGSKMARWGNSLADDTELAWGSIKNYLWGMRSWQKLQHQADPAYGIMEWEEYLDSLEVLTATAGEPRRRLTVEALKDCLEACDPTSFADVQYALFILILYFTFSRTECPCPKTWTGKHPFDPEQHWQVKDIQIMNRDGAMVLGVRFKRIKQDPRIERPEADPRGEGDWAYVGDVPDSVFSVFRWYKLLVSFYPEGRDAAEPFFMAKDRVRPLTYACAQADHKRLLIKAGRDPAKEGTCHGARVGGNHETSRNHPLGPEMAQAHGGWKSWTGKTRYDRYGIRNDVAPIAAYIVGAPNPYADADVVPAKEHDDSQSTAITLLVPPETASSPRVIGGRTTRKSKGGGKDVVNPFATVGSPGTSKPRHVSPPVSPSLPSLPARKSTSDRTSPAAGWVVEERSCRKPGGGIRFYKVYSLTLADGTVVQASSAPETWRKAEELSLSTLAEHLPKEPRRRRSQLEDLREQNDKF